MLPNLGVRRKAEAGSVSEPLNVVQSQGSASAIGASEAAGAASMWSSPGEDDANAYLKEDIPLIKKKASESDYHKIGVRSTSLRCPSASM